MTRDSVGQPAVTFGNAPKLWHLLERMQNAISAGMTPHLTKEEADLLAPVLPEGWEPE